MTKLLIVNTSDTVYNNPNFAMSLHPGYAVVVDADNETVKTALEDHPDKLAKHLNVDVKAFEVGTLLPLSLFTHVKVEDEGAEDPELEVVNKPAPRGRQKS
jgi:hypothetical protein